MTRTCAVLVSVVVCGAAPRLHAQDTVAASAADSSCTVATDVITTPPEPKKMKQPRYPDGLRNGGVQGHVNLRFVIGCDGKVLPGSVEVESATRTEFTKPAIEAVEKSQFKPALRDGRPVAFMMNMRMQFLLRGSKPRGLI